MGGNTEGGKKIMVNFGLNSASILGLFLAVAGAGLYFMRTVRPELSRDHDIFFAAVGLLCGLILMFQGWRLDPILQFSQFLLMGSAISFAVETIRLRGATVEQARRNNSFVDERPVSREYRAQLEELEPYEPQERPENKRRLRGYEDQRTSRSSAAYEDEEPRTTRTRRPPAERPSSNTRPRRSPPIVKDSYDDDEWKESRSDWEEPPVTRQPRRPRNEENTETPRQRRPPRNSSPYQDEPPAPTEYVDYHPIDSEPEEEQDEPGGNRDNPIRFDY